MLIKKTAAGLGVLALLVLPPLPAVGTTAQAQASPGSATPIPERFKRGTVVTGMPGESRAGSPAKKRTAGAHTIKIDVLDRSGKPPTTEQASRAYIWPLNGDWPLGADIQDGHGEEPIPPGDYAIYTYVTTPEAGGKSSKTLVYLPKVSVTGDISLILDARKARPIQVAVDRKDARLTDALVLVSQKIGPRVQATALNLTGTDLYITPAPPGLGLAYHLQMTLTRNGTQTGSPYVYNLASAAEGIPADPSLRARGKDLAVVQTRHFGQGGPACGGSHASIDWGIGVTAGLYAETGALPTTRTEYFTTGLDWELDEGVTTADCAFENADISVRTERFSRPGIYARQWNDAPFGPGAGVLDLSAADDTSLDVAMLSTWHAYGSGDGMRGTSTLRDASGNVVGTSSIPGSGGPWPSPSPGKHTLTVDAERSVPWSDLATRQHIVWDLDVQDQKIINLPVVRHRATLDMSNRAGPGSQQQISLIPEGLPANATPAFSISFDDGKTWQPVTVRPGGTASFRNPPSGHVSLRTIVPGVVHQTVIRAYAIS
ncbi:hypothetical protein [Actinomadura sp. 6N118]|uniref:hypothetical protein n=1 Tax=Actinomadura sp. 6N118 TaxID=3375151 RepID=UPI0037AE63C3